MSEQTTNFVSLTFGVDHFLITTSPNAIIFNKLEGFTTSQGVDLNNLKTATLENIVVPFSTYAEVLDFKTKLQNAYQVNTFYFKDFLFNFKLYSRASVDQLLDSVAYIERLMPRQYII